MLGLPGGYGLVQSGGHFCVWGLLLGGVFARIHPLSPLFGSVHSRLFCVRLPPRDLLDRSSCRFSARAPGRAVARKKRHIRSRLRVPRAPGGGGQTSGGAALSPPSVWDASPGRASAMLWRVIPSTDSRTDVTGVISCPAFSKTKSKLVEGAVTDRRL